MRKKVRTLRHWKQRFNKNADFIWRRPIIWQGENMEPGDPIPEALATNPTKLRRFWESRVIELAEFEEPDVLTGQKPAPVVQEPETLLGSDIQLSDLDINGETVPLGEIVQLAFEDSGLTVAEWNGQPDQDREERLQDVVEMMLDLGDEDEAPAKAPSIADKEPADLVSKETDRKWHVEGVEEVFKSKTLATEKAEAMIAEAKAAEDAWLDGDDQED